MNQKTKVDEMMEAKVDLSKLKQTGTYLNLHEKVTLELAVEFERGKDPDYVSVSWESQKEAQDYFNEHGFVDTLNLLVEKRKRNDD